MPTEKIVGLVNPTCRKSRVDFSPPTIKVD